MPSIWPRCMVGCQIARTFGLEVTGGERHLSARLKIKYDVAVVGGAGHVGIPLSLVLADHGLRTLIYDINQAALKKLQAGRMPFIEEGGKTLLHKALKAGKLGFSQDPGDLRGIPAVVLTIGTPIDEFHNPNFSLLTRAVDALLPHLAPRPDDYPPLDRGAGRDGFS